jgi:hypothetical protein
LPRLSSSSLPSRKALLVQSADDDPADEQLIIRVIVVVKTASPDRHEISGFSHLTALEESNLIYFLAQVVLGVWIRRHVVRTRVVVDEKDARSGWNDQLSGADGAARRNRDSVRILWRWGCRIAATAT